MQQTSLKSLVIKLRICIAAVLLVILCLFLFSFTIARLNENFLKELGISKAEADKKITGSILGGYLDAYGTRNAKNIILGKRSAVAIDLLKYVKQHAGTEAFKKEYAALKESYKPKENKIQSPEEMRNSNIEELKKSIAETEASLKKADANMKPIFEKILAQGKKQLTEAENPANKTFARYAKGYPELVKSNRQSYEQALQNWEAQYPANHLLFVKQRLQQFLETTKDIDFSAATTVKNGKKYFVKAEYERKDNRWKMAFRAGKEVVEPARAFVEQWISEIK
jgi:hypothetical protein